MTLTDTAPRRSSPTLIIVEDDEALLKILTAYFRSVGYRTRGYSSGEACVQSLEWSPEIDCILTDVRLPGMDGIGLLASLREHGVAAPVVLMTGHGDIPVAVRAMKAGAADFLEKPFEPSAVETSVSAAITSSRLARSRAETARLAVGRLARLTERQLQILDLITAGLTSKEIAAELGMSFRTVEAHRSTIMDRLEVGTLAELIKLKVSSQLTSD